MTENPTAIAINCTLKPSGERSTDAMIAIVAEHFAKHDVVVSETDGPGRMPSYSRVAVAAIVGNEDGAHWASSQLFQSLNDTGWAIPAVAACYWAGEAMGSIDFKDLTHRPRKVSETAAMVAANAVHLAGLLKNNPYPG